MDNFQLKIQKNQRLVLYRVLTSAGQCLWSQLIINWSVVMLLLDRVIKMDTGETNSP